jgi:sugar/nucleoside kinase (ribokinase family)
VSPAGADGPRVQPPDLVLLGNLLVDDVVFADGRTRMAQAGGAILYASLAAVTGGTRVGCVSLRGDDYPADALAALRERGVALDGVHDLGTNGVRTWLLYEGAVRRVVHRLGCPSHEAVSPMPEHVPAAWRRARAWHLAPMPIATQRSLVQAIRGWESPERPAIVSVDPHLPLTRETVEEWRSLLAHVDAFFPSDDEMRWPEATADPARALGSLAGGRLQVVAWKRGAAGGTLYDFARGRGRDWAPSGVPAVDPTGAGDAFAAGFLGAWLIGAPLEERLRTAVASAERAIGAWGPEALLAATTGQAIGREKARPA